MSADVCTYTEDEVLAYVAREMDPKAEAAMAPEVVLVGASRTMKTPTCLFLAYQRWFAGNVPLVPQLPLPRAVHSLPPERVFCLVMSAARLQQLR